MTLSLSFATEARKKVGALSDETTKFNGKVVAQHEAKAYGKLAWIFFLKHLTAFFNMQVCCKVIVSVTILKSNGKRRTPHSDQLERQ